MVHTSSVYKRIMAQKLRNRGYVSVSLGVINSLAQEGAKVTSAVAPWSAGNIFKPKNTEKVEYATLEEKSVPCDGSMVFMPETNQYKENGISAVNIGDSIRVDLDNTYDIRGLTIDFGQNYPTEFSIITNTGVVTKTNESQIYMDTGLILSGISYIVIEPVSMLYPNQRLKIREMLLGVGLYFDDSVVQSINCESYVSPIAENISYQRHTINVYDTQRQFDVDNPASFMQFLEPMQAIDISIGLDLGNNATEWVKMGSVYLQSWNIKNNVLTLVATDRLSQLQNPYSLGNRIYTRSAYEELSLILRDAGFEQDEYEIDDYLNDIELINPIPECLHREAIQLVCNATRCIFFEDENGLLKIMANFANSIAPADIQVSTITATPWSDPKSVLTNTITQYADLSYKSNICDGSKLLLPESSSEYLSNTGMVTNSIAKANGTFDDTLLMHFEFPAKFNFHAVKVSFAGVLPTRIKISAFESDRGSLVGTAEFTNIRYDNFFVLTDFQPFDVLLIEVLETEPYARCYVTKISFDNTTGYVLSSDLMTDYPQTYIDSKIRNTRVKVYTFEEDEEHKPREVEDNVYVTRPLALQGIDKTCENALISNETQAQAVAEWLAQHYKNNIDYSVKFRGEPSLQGGDIIQLSNQFKDTNVSIEKSAFSFNGAFSGKLDLRRVGYTNEEE